MNKKSLILIVDDLLDNRLMVKLALKRDGYDFVEAKNGEEAVEKAKKYNPDVIFMDAMMPVMDGYEATKIIRGIEKLKRTPIIMLTALSEKADEIKAIEYGVSDFVSKPFDKTKLQVRCKSYIELSNLNKKYVLINRDKDTKLPNKIALLDDLNSSKNPKLILFRIKDYELLENFYSLKNIKRVKKIFVKRLHTLLPTQLKKVKLYSVSESDFALLIDSQKEFFKDNLEELCHIFSQNVKKDIIFFENNRYNINILVSFSDNKDEIYTHARLGLNHAVSNELEVVYADKIIEETNKNITKNIKTIEMIKEALEKERVVSFFQPIYDNRTKKIYKYESLVRIIDKNNKIISPFFFLDIAKKSNYYLDISKIVIKNSFKTAKEKNVEISINISSLEAEDEETKEMILNLLHKDKSVAKKITFELLEDENIKDINNMKSFIDSIKKYGSKIAIDDFGSGYSSFDRLLEFQPDFLKIDGSLIKNINNNILSKNITETIQDFASRMKLKTVAEFVHNKEVFDIINDIGIDYTQGYYISEPKDEIKES